MISAYDRWILPKDEPGECGDCGCVRCECNMPDRTEPDEEGS